MFGPLFVCAAVLVFGLSGPEPALARPTVVSLTFDDGWDSQTVAAPMLAAHGMSGTFYVNGATVGTPGFLSWEQLAGFDAAGQEISGHTLIHPDLTTLTSTEARHEICDGRSNLLSHGFVATSFAYSFGAYDSTTGGGSLDVSGIVQSCGYSSGRGAFGLHNITATNDTRPYATSIPPPDLYEIKTSCCVNHASFEHSTPTASALESYVDNAARGSGGWVIFNFHRICDDCGGDNPAPSISPSELNAFLDWLQPRASSGIVVRTVGQVVENDTQPPTSSIACSGAVCSTGSYGGPVSVSLSAADAGPAGLATIRYTTDGSEPTVASPVYTGPFSVSVTTTVKYRAWDNASNVEPTRTQVIQIDTTRAISSITCNGSSCPDG